MKYHLAQANIAKALGRFDEPIIAGLIEKLDEINALAERSAGFIWRFKNDPTDTTYLRPFEDYFSPFEPERIFFNLSVWESVQSLKDYVFNTAHAELWSKRTQWISPTDKPHLAMWWIPAGRTPTVSEAKERLTLIQKEGVTAAAFDFRKSFPPPES